MFAETDPSASDFHARSASRSFAGALAEIRFLHQRGGSVCPGAAPLPIAQEAETAPLSEIDAGPLRENHASGRKDGLPQGHFSVHASLVESPDCWLPAG